MEINSLPSQQLSFSFDILRISAAVRVGREGVLNIKAATQYCVHWNPIMLNFSQ